MADPTTSGREVSAAAVGFGVAYLLGGVALAMQELAVLAPTWPIALPLLLVLVGLVVLVLGLTGAHRSRHDR